MKWEGKKEVSKVTIQFVNCRGGLIPIAVRLRKTFTVGATSGRPNTFTKTLFRMYSGGQTPLLQGTRA